MRIKHLLSTCLLLGSLASCTSDQVLPHEGGEINGNVPAQGAVVFSLEGLGSGSVVNPSTRATTVLATEEENRIDSLDIYVFAFDDNGTFDEDLTSKEQVVIDKLTPASEADVADSQKWYLQEKWTWKNPESGHSSGRVDTSLPQLHEIAQLGGSGVARTATIYPQQGRYLKFFIVANGGELTQTDADAPWTPAFTTTDAGTTTPGTTAADFLKLRIRLGARPLAADQVLPISCPLPMTAQMADALAGCVNLTAASTPEQATRSAVLTRAVTRFDIVNYAALPSQGDYTLTDVIINGHYAYTNMMNEVPAASAPKPAVKVNLEGRGWEDYKAGPDQPNGKLLKSAFYTSPTLGGTDPMTLGLRGVLGKSSAQPGELLTRLNKDVKVATADGTAIQLKANYRYLINIQKLGSDVNVAFSILDWDSRVLDADFSNAPMPILMCENAQGITWSVSDTDMNQHLVTMANTAVGGRLAFGLGTYNADEMADLILNPGDPMKIPFDAAVLSLNTDPSMPLTNTWLGKPVITFDPLKRDRFTVTLDVLPEAQVPLYVRPDLLVKVWNKEHREKEIFFRVTSTWTTPERPEAAKQPIVPGNSVYEVNGFYLTAPNADEAETYQWSTDLTALVMDTDPCAGHGKWRMPTMKDFEAMAGWQDSHPWSQEASSVAKEITDAAVIEQLKTALPNSWYWSSVVSTKETNNVWFFSSNPDNSQGIYSTNIKTGYIAVRCIWDDTL